MEQISWEAAKGAYESAREGTGAVRNAFIGALVVLVLGLAGALWYTIASRPAPGGPSIEARPAPELAHANLKSVPVKSVKVYVGETKAKLRLPPEVVTNPDKQVVAASQVRSDPRPQTVTTVIDTKTGESSSFVKVDPYPWFAIEARGTAQLALGYRLDPGAALPKQIVRLGVGYDVVRVKALTLGLVGTLDSDGQTFAGVGITYRW